MAALQIKNIPTGAGGTADVKADADDYFAYAPEAASPVTAR